MTGRIDTDYLFKLARDKSAEGRATLAGVINGLFDQKGDAVTDRERHLMMGILHGLVREVEASVRRNISSRLAGMPDAPRELVHELANDEIDVAFPILSESAVLRDEDLIDVIRLRTHQHQLAVTLRNDITEDVSAALVAEGNEQVIVSLLKNQTARISQATMAFLVEESRRVDSFQDPLLHREDLREDLAKRMFMWVSAALRRHIVGRYALDPDTVDELLEQAAREEIDNTATHRPAGGDDLRSTLREEGIISPNLVVAALLDGEASLFLKLFSAMTELNETLSSRIIFEEGGEALAIACKAVDVPEMQFSVIYDRTRKARIRKMTPQRAAERRQIVIDLYKRMTRTDAGKVLRRWQRGSDFLSAIRELEL